MISRTNFSRDELFPNNVIVLMRRNAELVEERDRALAQLAELREAAGALWDAVGRHAWVSATPKPSERRHREQLLENVRAALAKED